MTVPKQLKEIIVFVKTLLLPVLVFNVIDGLW